MASVSRTMVQRALHRAFATHASSTSSAGASSASAQASRQQHAPNPYLDGTSFSAAAELHQASRRASQDHVGPFPLPPGASDADREARIRAASRKWRDLGRAEKVGVAWQQTTSLIVVVAGGSLALLVLYATGTELWSEASPTKIFEDCVDRVKQSEELKTILIEPLTFHGANSSSRLRRNRRPSSALTTADDGSELMQVRFWVEGKAPATDGQDENKVWWDTVKEWVGPLVWEDSSKPGSYKPRPTHPPPNPPPEPIVDMRDDSWSTWLRNGLGSVFGGLVPNLKGPGQTAGSSATILKRARKPALGEYTTGEVVAELKKDPNTGHFVYQQLWVAIPDARHPNAYRIDINTNIVGEPQKGLDRLRFWRRSTTVAA
ncbi:hypothetical protein OIV83_006024 [Microbotryomycetes sp. JL201]|nr:hypothetical protein OIV83_006024 [Microbotryomycetes sp. JL201]